VSVKLTRRTGRTRQAFRSGSTGPLPQGQRRSVVDGPQHVRQRDRGDDGHHTDERLGQEEHGQAIDHERGDQGGTETLLVRRGDLILQHLILVAEGLLRARPVWS
jgi:hypothetical protein